ncbi:MAG: TPM domain-containing protein, partial [Polyangiaceae bacterium]
MNLRALAVQDHVSSSIWQRLFFVVLGVLILLVAPNALAAFYPAISSPVTDYSRVLTPDAKAKLAARIRDHQATFRVQTAVLLTPTTGDDNIADFAFRVAQASHLGDAKADSGVLVVIDTAHHAQRIEVGKGLEGGLPDITANRILAVAAADLRAEHYDVAVDKILTGIFAATAGESTAASDGSDAAKWQAGQDAIADHPHGYPMPWSILFVLFAAMLVVSLTMQWMKFWWKGAAVSLAVGAVAIPAALFALPFWASFYGPWVIGTLFGAVIGALYREERLTAMLLYVSAVTGAVIPVLFYKSMSDFT